MIDWWSRFRRAQGLQEYDAEGDKNIDVTFYWPEWHRFDEDGTLRIKASGWTGPLHWTGVTMIEPSSFDYSFWLWIINEKRLTSMIGNEEFENLKAEYETRALRENTEGN